MGRGDSLARQWKLMAILDERREVAVPEVARELGYTVRTVYRDLGVLERFGIPIYQERTGARARWRVVEGHKRKLSVTLSWSEMLALTAGRELLSGLSGSLFHESAISALEKIRSALPPELVKRTEAVAASVSATPGASHDYGQAGQRTQELISAIEHRETVELQYRKPRATKCERRAVDPLHLHVHSSALYLVGFAHERQAQRIFLLDRIVAVKRTGRHFEQPRSPIDATALTGAFGPWVGRPIELRLRLSRDGAPFVAERKMHPSQTSQWRSDGTLDVRLKVPVSPLLLQWLTGLGGDLLEVTPASVKKQLAVRHRAGARQLGDRSRRDSDDLVRDRVT